MRVMRFRVHASARLVLNEQPVSVATHKPTTTASQIVEPSGARLWLESRAEHPSTKLPVFLFTLVAAIFIAARLWHLTAYGIFGDEVFTLWTSAQDWRALFASVVGDVVHPPLFYAVLKVWIGIGGQSVLWLKLLPALFSVASVVPVVFLCRELRVGPGPMNLALWLMAVNGFLINQGQELRMYSLLLLLTVISLWLFAKLINEDARIKITQIMLCVVNLLMVFTHYYGWVIVALELVFILIWKRERLRSFAIAAAFLLLCFSPWVWFVSKAARANPSRVDFVWNRPPAASELVGYYGNLNGSLSYRWKVFGTALVMLVFLAPVVVWGWRVLRRRREEKPGAIAFWWLALFAIAPVGLAFVASHVLPQPWAFRYLIIAAPAYMLMVATAAFKLNRRPVRIVAVVTILLWSGLSGFTEVTNRDRIAWEPLVHRLIQAESESRSDIKIYVTDANVGNTIQFYLDRASDTRFQPTAIDNLNSPSGEHCWVAFIRYKHESHTPLQTGLSAAGYSVGDIIQSETSGDIAVLFPVWKR
jgi:Dolichyl-phosphate-mannose-protein mannosyltransferase